MMSTDKKESSYIDDNYTDVTINSGVDAQVNIIVPLGEEWLVMAGGMNIPAGMTRDTRCWVWNKDLECTGAFLETKSQVGFSERNFPNSDPNEGKMKPPLWLDEGSTIEFTWLSAVNSGVAYCSLHVRRRPKQ